MLHLSDRLRSISRGRTRKAIVFAALIVALASGCLIARLYGWPNEIIAVTLQKRVILSVGVIVMYAMALWVYSLDHAEQIKRMPIWQKATVVTLFILGCVINVVTNAVYMSLVFLLLMAFCFSIAAHDECTSMNG